MAQQILETSVGPGAHSGFGGVVAPAGDIDHDGVNDLLVGAPFDSTGGADTGLVQIISGASGSALLTLHGAAPGERFGAALASLGDVNGDSTADLLVGAPGALSGAGLARVHSGATGAVLRTVPGQAAGDQFGAAVAALADVNADGVTDLLLGAPGADVAGVGADAGTATVVSGLSGYVLHVFTGEHAGDHLGISVGDNSPGTLSVDSEPGVVISCTQDTDSAGVTGGTGLVRVHSRTDWSLRYTLSGNAPHDTFGSSVARAGDVNGDGTGDILVGSGAGYARLHSGADGALLGQWSGSASTGFGSSVAGVGDVNGDHVPDVALGEPGADGNGTDSGCVHLISGANKKSLHVVNGPEALACAGASIAFAGDLDGDALTDIAVGAPGAGAQGSAPGSLFTLSLTGWQNYGGGLPGIHDIPQLQGQGGLIAATQVELDLTGARSLASVTLVLGHSLSISKAKGTLMPTPDLVTTGLLTSAVGSLQLSFTWPDGIPSGQTVYYQFRVIDPAAVGGEAISNTLAATVP